MGCCRHSKLPASNAIEVTPRSPATLLRGGDIGPVTTSSFISAPLGFVIFTFL
jgi:hypothetical protein